MSIPLFSSLTRLTALSGFSINLVAWGLLYLGFFDLSFIALINYNPNDY